MRKQGKRKNLQQDYSMTGGPKSMPVGHPQPCKRVVTSVAPMQIRPQCDGVQIALLLASMDFCPSSRKWKHEDIA
jgi:hypothetical protein